MFRQSIRRFGTTALRAAEGSTPYAVRVSQSQGWVNGLTEGMYAAGRDNNPMKRNWLTIHHLSHWEHPSYPHEAPL